MTLVRRLLAPHGVRLTGSHVTGVSLDSCATPLDDEDLGPAT
jgi:hypothetical protein